MPPRPATTNGTDTLHDETLELALVGSIIANPAIIPAVLETGLERDDLYYHVHRLLWDATVSIHLAGGNVDAHTVATEVIGWGCDDPTRVWTIALDSVTVGLAGRVTVNAPSYAATLRKLAVDRRARNAALRFLEDLGDPSARVALERSLAEVAHPYPNGNRLIGRMSLGALRDAHFPIENQLCGGLVVKGYRTVIAGYVGQGKSTLTWQLVTALAARRRFLDWQPNRARVLVIDVEQGTASIQKKAREMGLLALADDPDVEVEIIAEPNGFPIDEDPAEAARIRATILDYAPDVVVIDPLYKLFGGSENDLERISRVVDTLDAWKHDLNVALIVPMHTNKPPVEMRGAAKPRALTLPDVASHSRMVRDAQVVVGLQQIRPGRSLLTNLKDRDGMLPFPTGSWRHLDFDLDQRRYSLAVDQDEEASSPHAHQPTPHDLVRATLTRLGPLTAAELADATGASRKTIYRALEVLGAEVAQDSPRGPWRLAGETLSDEPEDVF